MNRFEKIRQTMFKGCLEQAVGETATLTQSNGDDIRKYKIDGNTFQETAPASKNLFDFSSTEGASRFGVVVPTSFKKYDDYIQVKQTFANTLICLTNEAIIPVGAFTISGEVYFPALNGSKWVYVGYANPEDGTYSNNRITVSAFDTWEKVTFTSSINSPKKLYFQFQSENSAENANSGMLVRNIQVEVGENATFYEPYYPAMPSPERPSLIVSLGETGRNEFNVQPLIDISPIIASNGVDILSANKNSITMENGYAFGSRKRLKDLFPYIKVGTYTIFCDFSTTGALGQSALGTITDLTTSFFVARKNNEQNRYVVSITEEILNRNGNIYFYGGFAGSITTWSNLMCIEGDYTDKELPAYEPYSCIKIENKNNIKDIIDLIDLGDREPLRKVGDVSDYICNYNGINLFDVSKGNNNYWYISGNRIQLSNKYGTPVGVLKTLFPNIKKGTYTCCCSYIIESLDDSGAAVASSGLIGNLVLQPNITFVGGGGQLNKKLTRKTLVNVTEQHIANNPSIYFYAATGYKVTWYDFMLLEGDWTNKEISPYEEYQPKNNIVRKIGKYIIPENTNFDGPYENEPDSSLVRYFFATSKPQTWGTNLSGMSNFLPYIKDADWFSEGKGQRIHFGQSNTVIYLFLPKEIDTKDKVYPYISNNGKIEPYVLYQLAVPEYEPIELPILKTKEYTNIIEAYSGSSHEVGRNYRINAGNLELQYYQK